MNITIINKSRNKRSQPIKLKDGLISVNVTEEEAVKLINSLSEQIMEKNPNVGSGESFSEEGTLFIIWVSDFRKTREHHEMDIEREEYIKKSDEKLSWRTKNESN
jgi:hypothetical protein